MRNSKTDDHLGRMRRSASQHLSHQSFETFHAGERLDAECTRAASDHYTPRTPKRRVIRKRRCGVYIDVPYVHINKKVYMVYSSAYTGSYTAAAASRSSGIRRRLPANPHLYPPKLLPLPLHLTLASRLTFTSSHNK